ncbi:MAG TPA: hypothetical protein VKO43_01580 [Candidatus Krumholzibacteriaceae bacterium]|nr:hypothetical protein [Candidatus Krumholzibacteriaceae bacterium]
MNSEEMFIKKIMRQRFPYRPEKDIKSQSHKWEVTPGEYITSWLRLNLLNCRKENKCDRDQRCSFFSYSDLAKQNYSICREMILRLENGQIKCDFDIDKKEG